MQICSAKECNKGVFAKGWCEKYYYKAYHLENREKINLRHKEYYEQNKHGKIKQYYIKNNERKRVYDKKYREENRKKRGKYWLLWSSNNKESIRLKDMRYRENNKEKKNAYNNEYQKKQRAECSQFRLNCNIRRAISLSLKGNKNGRHWEGLVGFTLIELKSHLEKQFDENMGWQNYGSSWVIDHTLPLYCFKDSSEEIILKKGWALQNLRPLDKIENAKKGKQLVLV